MASTSESQASADDKWAAHNGDDTTSSVPALTATAPRDQASSSASASALVTSFRTTFLDLAPELRNRIYSLALVESSRELMFKRVTSSESGNLWRLVAITRPDDFWAPRHSPDINAHLMQTGIPQIDAEATSILYSSNHFVINFEHNLEPFDETTFCHIRRLKFTDGRFDDKQATLAQLTEWAPICKLEKLEFCYESFWWMEYTAKEVAKLLWPFVKALLKAEKEPLVKTLEFFPEDYREEDNAEKFTMDVKEEIQSLLDAGPTGSLGQAHSDRRS